MTALIVVDVQRGLDDDAYWGPSNNPDCETNIGILIAAGRDHELPTVRVRHGSEIPATPLAHGMPGNGFEDVVTGTPDLLVSKQVSSCFYGTPNLQAWLDERGIDRTGPDGVTLSADELARATATNLHAEFATVIDTAGMLALVDPRAHRS